MSGIVVGINENTTQLQVARFPSEIQRGPGLIVVSDAARQFCMLLQSSGSFVQQFTIK